MSRTGAPLAVSSGEPAGIGPELCLRLAEKDWPVVILADRTLLAERAAQLQAKLVLRDYVAGRPSQRGVLDVLHLPLAEKSRAGQLTAANSRYVLALLDRALAGCQSGEFSGMVTAPVHKGIINEAGIPFTGHTEYLAEKTGTPRVVMMLAGAGLRVALATTHLALKDVAKAITREDLTLTLRILHSDLQRKFRLPQPRILVAGLNPHAGEDGHMGREEIDVITPVLASLRQEGMNLIGPLPADTLFTRKVLAGSDAQLAMYHDQGLAVLKYAAFEEGINITLGLPILRTSVDHGTALDLAGSGRADPGSLYAAVGLAAELASRPE